MKEFVQMLPPDKLLPFEKHPFQVREDGALEELMESIRAYGVLSPLLARPKGEGTSWSAAIGGVWQLLNWVWRRFRCWCGKCLTTKR